VKRGRVAEERARGRRLPQIVLFVTIPGLLLGSASLAAAYTAGWMSNPAAPKPSCVPQVVRAPGRGSFVLNVMNAAGRDGLGGQVAVGLAKRGFRVSSISNAPDSWYVTQSAVVHHGPAGLDQALLAASQIPGAKLFDDGRPGTSVDVVVGMGYKTMVPVPARLRPVPSEVQVNVYNTTYRTGLARTVAAQLKVRGFAIKDVSNDPQRTLQLGTAIIRYGDSGDLAAALLGQHVPGARLVKDTRAGAAVDLVLGNAYTSLTPLAKVPPIPPRPKPQTPTVTRPCP
jgi:hypothetical protein